MPSSKEGLDHSEEAITTFELHCLMTITLHTKLCIYIWSYKGKCRW